MLLSAAIIVRDEADHLDACLASLSGLVDEIVVVDTGSSDDSVAVADRHGAIVARELGIPCVINTRSGTQRISTGDRLRIDGTSGEVVVLQQIPLVQEA